MCKFIADQSGAVTTREEITVISLWNLPRTKIVHILTCSDLATDHTVRYQSQRYHSADEKAWEREFLDDL